MMSRYRSSSNLLQVCLKYALCLFAQALTCLHSSTPLRISHARLQSASGWLLHREPSPLLAWLSSWSLLEEMCTPHSHASYMTCNCNPLVCIVQAHTTCLLLLTCLLHTMHSMTKQFCAVLSLTEQSRAASPTRPAWKGKADPMRVVCKLQTFCKDLSSNSASSSGRSDNSRFCGSSCNSNCSAVVSMTASSMLILTTMNASSLLPDRFGGNWSPLLAAVQNGGPE